MKQNFLMCFHYGTCTLNLYVDVGSYFVKSAFPITDQQITLQLQETITNSFQVFTEMLLKTFNQNPNLGQLPIKVRKKNMNRGDS